MKRTTIMIPSELKTRPTRHAKKIGMSLGGFIRESLEKAIAEAILILGPTLKN